jgi:hypothetical protein
MKNKNNNHTKNAAHTAAIKLNPFASLIAGNEALRKKLTHLKAEYDEALKNGATKYRKRMLRRELNDTANLLQSLSTDYDGDK